jgi:hypothetical protein
LLCPSPPSRFAPASHAPSDAPLRNSSDAIASLTAVLGDETDAAVTVAKAVLQVQAANACWDKGFVNDMMREKEVCALIAKAGAHPSLLKNSHGFSVEQCREGGKASAAVQLKNKSGLFKENEKGERIYKRGRDAQARAQGSGRVELAPELRTSPRTAFRLFVIDRRAELKESQDASWLAMDSGSRVSFLAEQWKDLPDCTKKPFSEAAATEKQLWVMHCATSAPASTRAAFRLFKNQRRAELKESQDASWLAMDSGSRVSFLAKQWKNLPDCTKKPFSEAAVTERQQYQQHQQHQHQQQQQQQAQAQAQAQQQANAAEVARVEAKATEKAAAKAKVKADAEAAAAAAEAAAAEAEAAAAEGARKRLLDAVQGLTAAQMTALLSQAEQIQSANKRQRVQR